MMEALERAIADLFDAVPKAKRARLFHAMSTVEVAAKQGVIIRDLLKRLYDNGFIAVEKGSELDDRVKRALGQ